jgi:hypothetical protein
VPRTSWTPSLTVTECAGRVRLQLGVIARGEGGSLQDAADDLIGHLLTLVHALRSSGFKASSEARLDLDTIAYLYEMGEITAAGGDIRGRVFG